MPAIFIFCVIKQRQFDEIEKREEFFPICSVLCTLQMGISTHEKIGKKCRGTVKLCHDIFFLTS